MSLIVAAFAVGLILGALIVYLALGYMLADRSSFDLPPATGWSLKRKQLAARADLRHVLPNRIWWWQ